MTTLVMSQEVEVQVNIDTVTCNMCGAGVPYTASLDLNDLVDIKVAPHTCPE